MHGVAGVPESPQAGGFRPGQALYEPRQAAALYNPSQLSFDSPQRRLGKRAPKLGDIGRSKKGDQRCCRRECDLGALRSLEGSIVSPGECYRVNVESCIAQFIYDPRVSAILDDTGPSTVVIEDEELDDILNNNGLFPLSVHLTPVA